MEWWNGTTTVWEHVPGLDWECVYGHAHSFSVTVINNGLVCVYYSESHYVLSIIIAGSLLL